MKISRGQRHYIILPAILEGGLGGSVTGVESDGKRTDGNLILDCFRW